MKEETYRAMAEAVKETPLIRSYIVWFNRIVTMTVFLLYPALLILLYINKADGLLPAVLIPGISLAALTIYRSLLNRPRPYEVFDMEPVLDRKGTGHSFPSRHIFSIFIIAVTVFYFYHLVGVLIGIVGAALAVNRVIGGVHFVRDVVAGALAGIGCGVIGFYVILPIISSAIA